MRTIRLSRPVLVGLSVVGLSVAGGLTPMIGQARDGCSLAALQGAFGTREAGTIPVAALVAEAIEDALEPLGVRIREMPLSPSRLRELIEEASARRPA